MLDINALVHAAEFEKRTPTEFEGDIPPAILKMVEDAFESRKRVTLPADGREQFDEIKALILTAARHIERSGSVVPVHVTHTVNVTDPKTGKTKRVTRENKEGHIVGARFTIGIKRGPGEKATDDNE